MKLLVVQFQPSRSSLDGPWIDIYSKGLQNASPTRDKHMYTTCLEVGAFVDIEISFPEESRKPSSFFVHRSSKIKPPTALWINNHPPASPSLNGPLKKAFIVHRSSTVHPQGSSPNGPFGSTTSTNPLIRCSSSPSLDGP
ncbi:hypothetical protein ACFX12_039976 [Malus domestica]